MNKQEKEQLIAISNSLQQERQCCDMLADALIHGGMDRVFDALRFHETLRNGVRYPGATLGKPKPKRRRNHPTMGYYTYGADQTPFDQDEEQ
jgi:hypothetical protein